MDDFRMHTFSHDDNNDIEPDALMASYKSFSSEKEEKLDSL